MSEAEQLRVDIQELCWIMDTLPERDNDGRLAEACSELIAERLDRLDVLELAERDRTL